MAFAWEETPEGQEHWEEMANRFRDMAKHGTSDGKPWVEPEPEIPEGYRKAEPGEWKRKDVKFWSHNSKDWRERSVQGYRFDSPHLGTIYIVPIDPPLTDRDACVWPRLLVMVRDEESKPWRGPVEFHGICPGSGFPFSVMGVHDKLRGIAAYARRATPAEIEAAK